MSSAIVSSLSQGGDVLVAWIVRANCWTAALFVLAFAADRLLARRVAPTWRMALYGAVFVRLLIPFDLSTPFGLLPSTSDVASASVPVTVRAAELADPREVMRSAIAPSAVWAWTAMVAPVYVIGIAVLVWRWRRDAVRLRAIVRESALSVAALPDDLVIREHATHGPLLIGVRRPVLVIPRALVEALAPAALRDIVRHESAHVARRDPLGAAILHVAVIIAWPIIPVWWTCSRIRALMEIAADERALRGADGEARTAYGRTLVDVASAARHLIDGSALAFTASIEERVAALRRASRWRGVTQAVACTGLVAVIVACSTRQETTTAEPTSATVATPAAAPFDPVSGDYPQVLWMVNIFTVDGPLDFASDGALMQRSGKAAQTRAYSREAFTPMFSSLDTLRGFQMLSSPALVAKPDTASEISIGTEDKAGQAADDFGVTLQAHVVDDGRLSVTSVLTRRAEEGGTRDVAEAVDLVVDDGGAAVMIAPDADRSSWVVVVLRPRLIRSLNEYPFQRSTALEEAPAESVPILSSIPLLHWLFRRPTQ